MSSARTGESTPSNDRQPPVEPSNDPSVEPPSGPSQDDWLAEVFESDHEEHLDEEALERTLASMLDRYPQAPVVAVSVAGIFLDMPDSISLRENPILEGRSGLDNMSPQDRAVPR